jgi:hypothetical protein
MFASPNVGTNFNVMQTDFFDEFAAQSGHMIFAFIESTTRKCPTSSCGKFKAHQQDVLAWGE